MYKAKGLKSESGFLRCGTRPATVLDLEIIKIASNNELLIRFSRVFYTDTKRGLPIITVYLQEKKGDEMLKDRYIFGVNGGFLKHTYSRNVRILNSPDFTNTGSQTDSNIARLLEYRAYICKSLQNTDKLANVNRDFINQIRGLIGKL